MKIKKEDIPVINQAGGNNMRVLNNFGDFVPASSRRAP